MPVTSWNVEYWEGTYEVTQDSNGNQVLKYNKIKQLQDKDTIENDHALLIFLSISGYTPSGDIGGFYKATVYLDAYAKETDEEGHSYDIRPYSVLAYGDTLQVSGTYQAAYQQAGEKTIDITNYYTNDGGTPAPGFPSTGGTDTWVLAVGPFQGQNVENLTIVTFSNTIDLYDADVKSPAPGPTPTSEQSSNKQ